MEVTENRDRVFTEGPEEEITQGMRSKDYHIFRKVFYFALENATQCFLVSGRAWPAHLELSCLF